jgi:hypothetical protein
MPVHVQQTELVGVRNTSESVPLTIDISGGRDDATRRDIPQYGNDSSPNRHNDEVRRHEFQMDGPDNHCNDIA